MPPLSSRLRLCIALFLALMQVFLPVAAQARVAGNGAPLHEICSVDPAKAGYVLVDGELVPPPAQQDDGGKHCALCVTGNGALPSAAFAGLPVITAGAQLIALGATFAPPAALRLSPPPRGPPAAP